MDLWHRMVWDEYDWGDECPIWGNWGSGVPRLCHVVHNSDTRLTLPPIFAREGIRFGGAPRLSCKYTNLPDFHAPHTGEHSQH